MANFIDRATRAELEREAEKNKREDYERQKQELLAAANALFEKHPAYSKAEIQIYEKSHSLQAVEPLESLEKGSEERLVRTLKALDIRSEAYVQLVSDLEHLKAFRQKLNWFVWEAWMHCCGFPLDMVPAPIPTFPLNEHQAKAKRLWDRAHHWYIEGHRQIDRLNRPKAVAPKRRGYRAEVKAWMEHHQIPNQQAAAKRLGKGLDTLKAIMSGDSRCAEETVQEVLGKILPQGSDW